MNVDLVAVIALVAGIYIIHKAEKAKSIAKTAYVFTGFAVTIWALMALFGGQMIRPGIEPLAIGFFAIGAMQSKGLTQTVFGAVALLIFLSVFF